ncbi:hypothetical protein I4U23_004941 [Adineta vaga]|nr:hypothetical protein I4U23_004941 [Adineta vaga]
MIHEKYFDYLFLDVFNVGRWSVTGSLAIGRITHTSTLLFDGRVITIGGNEGGSSAEFYSPATGTWTQGPSMIDARSYHTATLLPDGRLFVTGGWYYNTNIKSAEIYSPATNSWTAVGNMNFGRYGHQAIYLPAPINKILVMGGYGTSYSILQTCELYDFATNQWTITTPMINGRTYFTATYLPSLGKVVAIGGSFPDKSAEMFTPSTLQWTRSINTMDWRQEHTATLLPNGQVLVAGGSGYIKTVYLFNPTTNSFLSAANTTDIRTDASATLLPSGLVLITGGYDSTNTIYRSAEVYDYNLDKWRPVASLNRSRFRHKSLLLSSSSSQSSTVLVVGGQKEMSMSLTSCELYSI